MTLTFGSLFAGIGGFDEGLRLACISPTFAVEIDETANAVRRRHFPDEEQHTDVTRFSIRSTAHRPGVICGGFPCQDLSVAGKRAGLAGERSGLFFEFMRIVREFSPGWVLIENVPGLCSSWSGDSPSSLGIDPGPGRTMDLEETSDFSTVLDALSELGYGTAYRVLDSQWFGVPQRRRRVFIVGCLGDWRRAAQVLFELESLPWDSPPSRSEKSGIAGTIEAGAGVRRGAGINPGSITEVFGGNNTGGPIDVATACNAKGGSGRMDFESETFVTCPLTGNPYGDHESRETLLVPVALRDAQDAKETRETEGALGVSMAVRRLTPT
jgi:DNA (cytosine-5)-methyltransferase 1